MSYKRIEPIVDKAVEREFDRVAQEFTSGFINLRLMRVAPKPSPGLVVICDGTSWNPLGDGIRRPIWYDHLANAWKAF